MSCKTPCHEPAAVRLCRYKNKDLTASAFHTSEIDSGPAGTADVLRFVVQELP